MSVSQLSADGAGGADIGCLYGIFDSGAVTASDLPCRTHCHIWTVESVEYNIRLQWILVPKSRLWMHALDFYPAQDGGSAEAGVLQQCWGIV